MRYCTHDVGERDAASYDDCPICLKQQLAELQAKLDLNIKEMVSDMMKDGEHIAQLIRDKERLDWLEGSTSDFRDFGLIGKKENGLREAIDAARRGEG